MNLTINELAVLKETPFPGDILCARGADSRSNIAQRAYKRLGIPNHEVRALLASMDQLQARGYVERVSLGFFRRTFEGHQALLQNARNLQDIAARLAA
jgi:hypothetical protein